MIEKVRDVVSTKIKKYWLGASVLYFVSQLFDAYLGDPYLHSEFRFQSLVLIIPFGYLGLEILNFIGLFLFSYKKQGTSLLTLNMIVAAARLGAIISPLLFWREISAVYANRTNGQFAVDSLVSFIYFLILAQWLVFSFKLRKENAEIRKNELLSHPECQKCMQDLKTANHLEDLSLRYGASVQSYPQIAGVLKKIYEQRRLELSQTDS